MVIADVQDIVAALYSGRQTGKSGIAGSAVAGEGDGVHFRVNVVVSDLDA